MPEGHAPQDEVVPVAAVEVKVLAGFVAGCQVDGRQRYLWSDVSHLLEAKDVFVLLIRDNQGRRVLPKRAFRPDELAGFRGLAAKGMAAGMTAGKARS